MLPSAAENEENDLLQNMRHEIACAFSFQRHEQNRLEAYSMYQAERGRRQKGKRQKPRPASQVELDSYDRMYLRISPLDEG